MLASPYFSRAFPDTNNPTLLYVAQTSLYRSSDGGKTFEAYVGAPSGDDFHVLWSDPENSARMLLGVDQGAIVSVDAGKSWTSWYNQPTGQFYHVSTDNLFPYRVFGAQQDSGTAAILSRSDYGQILLQGKRHSASKEQRLASKRRFRFRTFNSNQCMAGECGLGACGWCRDRGGGSKVGHGNVLIENRSSS